MVISVGTTFKIILAIPMVYVADSDVVRCIVVVVDGQVQSVSTWTSCRIGIVVGVNTGFNIITIIPYERFTGSLNV